MADAAAAAGSQGHCLVVASSSSRPRSIDCELQPPAPPPANSTVRSHSSYSGGVCSVALSHPIAHHRRQANLNFSAQFVKACLSCTPSACHFSSLFVSDYDSIASLGFCVFVFACLFPVRLVSFVHLLFSFRFPASSAAAFRWEFSCSSSRPLSSSVFRLVFVAVGYRCLGLCLPLLLPGRRRCCVCGWLCSVSVSHASTPSSSSKSQLFPLNS
jgi:hypothetical protein